MATGYYIYYQPGNYANENDRYSEGPYNSGTEVSIISYYRYTRDGYDQIGWTLSPNDDSDVYAFGASITMYEDRTFYPAWGKKQYTLTVKDINNYDSFYSLSPSQGEHQYPWGTEIELLADIRSDYDFNGWMYFDEENNSWKYITTSVSGTYIMPEKNITIGINTSKRPYTITYDANGGSGAPDASSVNVGSSLTISSTVPTYFPRTFLGWSTSPDATSASYIPGSILTPSSDITLYAVWGHAEQMNLTNVDPYQCNIDFENQEKYFFLVPLETRSYLFESSESSDPKIYIYNSSGVELDSNDDGGDDYNFKLKASLTADELYYIKIRMFSGNTGIIKFTALPMYTIRTSIRPMDTNGNVINGLSFTGAGIYAAGTSVTLTASSSNSDFVFLYIYDPSNDVIYSDNPLTITISKDQDLVAIFTENTYTITYDANGGSVSPSQDSVKIGSSIKTPEATRNNGTSSRKVDFNANGGTTTKSSQISSATITYTSDGWYTEGGTIRTTNGGSYTPTQSETLYAQWDSFTGTYSAITFPSADECRRDGYTLLGFSSSSTATTATYDPETSHIVSGTWYAIWEKTITLSYDSNGGSGTLPDNQNITIYNATTSASFTIDPNSQASLSRTGHTFLGWSTSSDASEASYSQGDTINISNDTMLYAVWKVNQYTIIASTYLINEDGSETETVTGGWVEGVGSYNYNTQQTITAVPSSALYSFYKWENGSTNPIRTIIIPANDINVTAYFSPSNLTLVANNVNSGDISLWIREKNVTNNTYKDWRLYDWELGEFSLTSTIVQFIVEDGENYEFTKATISQGIDIEAYVDYDISDSPILYIYSQPIPTSNKIFVGGKTNGLKTSGYVKDPNISFEEPIKSIWIGNQQIMGKSPTREYPYIIDTLLGNTLYVGLYNSIDDWKNGADMKTEIPTSAYYNNTIIENIKMSNNIKTISSYAFRGCPLMNVELSTNLETIGAQAFYGHNFLVSQYIGKIKKIFIPSSVSNIEDPGWSTFNGSPISGIEKIIVSLNNLYYSSDAQGALYNKEKTELIIYPSGRLDKTNYTLPFIEGSLNTEQCFTNSRIKHLYYKGTKDQWNNLINCIQPDTGDSITVHCVDGETFTIYY